MKHLRILSRAALLATAAYGWNRPVDFPAWGRPAGLVVQHPGAAAVVRASGRRPTTRRRTCFRSFTG